MKIAVAAPTYIPSHRANTMQVMKMTHAIAELGHEVRLAIPGQQEAEITWENLAYQYGLRENFPVVWLSRYPKLRSYDYGVHVLRWVRSWKADLLYTRHPQAAALASLSGFPTILEVHDLPQGRVGPKLFSAFLNGRGARRLVILTHALGKDLETNYGAPIVPPFSMFLPDGVDLERYHNLPDPQTARQELIQIGALPKLDPKRFTAGYTGHYYAGRGLSVLLELARRLPTFAFLLVGGESPGLTKLKQRVAEQGLKNIYLAGFIPNTELPTFQAACDVLLMPYQKHVAASSGGDIGRYLSPMKLFEYMASRRPILSGDLPVLREVLNEQNAVLLPPEDVGAWQKALQEIKAHPDNAQLLADQAYRQVQQYTWKNRAHKMLTFA